MRYSPFWAKTRCQVLSIYETQQRHTDIRGIEVGHAQDDDALTGCTAILCRKGAVAGVDVRGGGPGTRETDLLNPINLVQKVHAVTLWQAGLPSDSMRHPA
jgi:L-aminopeptidase/D-esterase-like protein